ncbi:MAG: hypothetical protein ACTSW3_02100 [Promethearchaeota archaeon]
MIVKKIVKQSSGVYTITIPKGIIESKGWENAEFKIKLTNNQIILTKLEKRK